MKMNYIIAILLPFIASSCGKNIDSINSNKTDAWILNEYEKRRKIKINPEVYIKGLTAKITACKYSNKNLSVSVGIVNNTSNYISVPYNFIFEPYIAFKLMDKDGYLIPQYSSFIEDVKPYIVFPPKSTLSINQEIYLQYWAFVNPDVPQKFIPGRYNLCMSYIESNIETINIQHNGVFINNRGRRIETNENE